MHPLIELGPLSLPTGPLLVLAGFWLGSVLAQRRRKNRKRDPGEIDNLIWTALVAGLVGARLSFFARQPAAFKGQWLSILSPNPALFDLAGGVLIALAAGAVVMTRRNLNPRVVLDDLVPFFGSLLPAVYLANLAAGKGYGTFTQVPWAIDLWGGSRHPVQLYYALSGLVVAGLHIRGALNRWAKKPGQELLLFSILTAGYLTFFSAFQDPKNLAFNGFSIAQVIYWLLFSLSLLLYTSTLKEDPAYEASK